MYKSKTFVLAISGTIIYHIPNNQSIHQAALKTNIGTYFNTIKLVNTRDNPTANQ